MRQLKINSSFTLRDSVALGIYMKEVGSKPLLTVEEEVALVRAYRKGDQKAFVKLVSGNLRFVISVAKQYQNQGLSLSDLISEGNFGLMKAIEKFDETRGFKFISYAVWWIRQSILQAIAEQSRMVRLPLIQIGLQNKIGKVSARFEQANGRKPSVEELSDEMDVPVDNITDLLQISGRTVSVDAPFAKGEVNSLSDTIVDNDAIADKRLNSESLSKEINRVLSSLGKRDCRIIKLYYGIGCREETMNQIGERFGISGERVRQIKDKGLRRLRQESRNNLLRAYLG